VLIRTQHPTHGKQDFPVLGAPHTLDMGCTRGEGQHLAFIVDTELPLEKTAPTKAGQGVLAEANT